MSAALTLLLAVLLDALAGEPFAIPPLLSGLLSGPLSHRGKRPSYQPCRIDQAGRRQGLPSVEPLAWRGSADLANLTRANALARLHPGDYVLEEGTRVEVVPL